MAIALIVFRSSFSYVLSNIMLMLMLLLLLVQVITGAQPKAGTGLKMQTVRFFNFRDISLTWDISLARYFWECSLAHWNLIRHFEKHEAWRTVKRKIIAFAGMTLSPSFTMH